MSKSVVETHPYLYHYTTAAGLKGIIESQQLWATNIAYLNDAEEHTGFFDRRLPHILEMPVKAAFKEIKGIDLNEVEVDEHGGVDQVAKDLIDHVVKIYRATTLEVNNPYVTSFCSATPGYAPNNGLLSQWRGYGTDGGYAIVFETVGLQQLIEEECNNFLYQYSTWGDVEYYDKDAEYKATHQETLNSEEKILQTIRSYILKNNPNELEGLSVLMTMLSCMHKHRGFSEEAEVRIVAVPLHSEMIELIKNSGDERTKKPINFVMRNGILVPYIKLFGGHSNGSFNKLPISKIIVGPHPNRFKRKRAVELMLEQYEIKAEVTVSDIPYLGR